MDTTYTTTKLAPVTLAGTTFTVTRTDIAYTDRHGERRTGVDVHLTGPRGAVYFLRGFLGADDGLRAVISHKSGAPLRKHGNEIRVVHIGNVIEQVVPARVTVNR